MTHDTWNLMICNSWTVCISAINPPSHPLTKDQMILKWSFRTSSISQSLKKVNEMRSSNSSDIPPGSPKKEGPIRVTGDWNWLKRSIQHTQDPEAWGLTVQADGIAWRVSWVPCAFILIMMVYNGFLTLDLGFSRQLIGLWRSLRIRWIRNPSSKPTGESDIMIAMPSIRFLPVLFSPKSQNGFPSILGPLRSTSPESFLLWIRATLFHDFQKVRHVSPIPVSFFLSLEMS